MHCYSDFILGEDSGFDFVKRYFDISTMDCMLLNSVAHSVVSWMVVR